MPELFDKFPYLENDKIIIRNIEISDLPALKEISDNENVYKYVPYFLYKKSEKVLETAIRNIGGRDFIKKKQIIAGIYSKDASDKLVGLAEMYIPTRNPRRVYKREDNGYKIIRNVNLSEQNPA